MSASRTLPACIAAAEDINAGNLLYRIGYWQPRAKVRMGDGAPWIAHTRVWWCAETGLTLKQYKRALVILKARRLVEVEIHKFAGVPTTYVRLADCAMPRQVIGPCGDQPVGPLGDHPIEQGVTYTEVHTKEEEAASPQPATGEGMKVSMEDRVTAINGRMRKTASEAAAKKPHVHGVPASPKQAEQEWRKIMAEVYPGVWVGPWNVAQLKMIQHVMAKVPGELWPTFLPRIIKGWVQFGQLAKEQEGAFNLPAVPQVGFLLKFLNSAITCMVVAPKQGPASNQGVSIAAKVPTPQSPNSAPSKEVPLTLEEANELLFG